MPSTGKKRDRAEASSEAEASASASGSEADGRDDQGQAAQAAVQPGQKMGASYDSSSMPDDARVAIRIGSAIFMPDKEVAIKVNAFYSGMKEQLYHYSNTLTNDDHPEWNINRQSFEKVKASIHNSPDLHVGGYTIRARLSYSPAEQQGSISITHVKMSAMRGKVYNHVYFIPLRGALAEDIGLYP